MVKYYVNKWKKGSKIKSVSQAVNLIINKKIIFLNHKPYHWGWSSSWSLMTIHRFINSGLLFKSKENKCRTK